MRPSHEAEANLAPREPKWGIFYNRQPPKSADQISKRALPLKNPLDIYTLCLHTYRIPVIKPLPNRVLVKVLPRYGDSESKLNLVLVDNRKHFEGNRRGIVIAIGDGVREVNVGDIVWFLGAQGKSFDENELGANDGVGMRLLQARHIFCVEDPIRDQAEVAA